MPRMTLFVCLALPALSAPLAAQERRTEVVVERDVVFGKGGRSDLKLDLARPKEGDGPFPMIVCIHGGGWVGGDRKQMNQALTVLANRGFVAISPACSASPLRATVWRAAAATATSRAGCRRSSASSGRPT